ncbi:hypothetical protein KO465_02755 [Candidatus Micrarchaeota archaeon]|nr:hypothetical protein [Candidatus Micrarchaeota archaeon]
MDKGKILFQKGPQSTSDKIFFTSNSISYLFLFIVALFILGSGLSIIFISALGILMSGNFIILIFGFFGIPPILIGTFLFIWAIQINKINYKIILYEKGIEAEYKYEKIYVPLDKIKEIKMHKKKLFIETIEGEKKTVYVDPSYTYKYGINKLAALFSNQSEKEFLEAYSKIKKAKNIEMI